MKKYLINLKLLRKNTSCNVMEERRLNRDFDIMDMDNDFYLVKFNLSKDNVTLEVEGPFDFGLHSYYDGRFSQAIVSIVR